MRVTRATQEPLERACRSIQFRVRLELLGQDRSERDLVVALEAPEAVAVRIVELLVPLGRFG